MKDPQNMINFHSYIRGFVAMNGKECLGRAGSLDDIFRFPYRESYIAMCEPIISQLFKTQNSKAKIMTFSIMTESNGNDIVYEAARFFQKEFYGHEFLANHWKDQEALVTGSIPTEQFSLKQFNFETYMASLNQSASTAQPSTSSDYHQEVTIEEPDNTLQQQNSLDEFPMYTDDSLIADVAVTQEQSSIIQAITEDVSYPIADTHVATNSTEHIDEIINENAYEIIECEVAPTSKSEKLKMVLKLLNETEQQQDDDDETASLLQQISSKFQTIISPPSIQPSALQVISPPSIQPSASPPSTLYSESVREGYHSPGEFLSKTFLTFFQKRRALKKSIEIKIEFS